jgi:protein-S-isoprenylcysteine O-methyltransferase Ste14
MNQERGSIESAPAADRPGVIALPPLIYLAALIAGVLLQRVLPLTLPVPTAARWAGGALIAAGVALGIAGRAAFARAGTNANPMEPATALVTSGLYQRTRNPMYVGMTLLLVGLALAVRSGWLLVVLAPVLAVMHWGVVRREERYLARKFGAEYEAYRARVRRYL